MSDYYNRNNRRKKRSRREKIGFYTAFSICLIAVCMAVYSTYNTLSVQDKTNNVIQVTTSEAVQVNENISGIKETLAEPKLNMERPTIVAAIDTQPQTTEPTVDSSRTALQTMLSTDITLGYPLNSNNVLREYNEKSVYFKTLNVWKPHTGVDFSGDLGEDVNAMTGGAVTKIYDDKMFGQTVEISTNNVVCIYSGLGSINVKERDSVESGDKIGSLGTVPFEASDANHVHIAVKIDGKYADPLIFIKNDE